jgi:hypothetical protein
LFAGHVTVEFGGGYGGRMEVGRGRAGIGVGVRVRAP